MSALCGDTRSALVLCGHRAINRQIHGEKTGHAGQDIRHGLGTEDAHGAKAEQLRQQVKQGEHDDHLAQERKEKGCLRPSQTILDSCGKLLPAVSDILKLIADADIVLATGHLNPKTEIPPLLEEAVRLGVKKIVIIHPEFFRDHTLEEMRAYSDAGFYVERILATLYSKKQTYDGLFKMVETGGERVIISSDLGQIGRPNPVVGLTRFIEEMQARCVSDGRLRQIMSRNQRELLGLEPLEE